MDYWYDVKFIIDGHKRSKIVSYVARGKKAHNQVKKIWRSEFRNVKKRLIGIYLVS